MPVTVVRMGRYAVYLCPRCLSPNVPYYRGQPAHDEREEEDRCWACGEWFVKRDWIPAALKEPRGR